MTGRGAPETVFDGEWMRARLWRPSLDAGTLYVTFRQFMPQPGTFSDDRPVGRVLARGIAHLHVQTRMNDWYVNAETPALEQVLRRLRGGFGAARAIGFSMGGYAALRLASALALDQVMLVSPQFTLDRDIVPTDHRYPEAATFDTRLGDLREHGKRDLFGAVLFDPFRPLDKLHAWLIQEVMPGVSLAPCGFGGHPATKVIVDGGGFRHLQGLSIEARLRARDVVALHRRLRHGSAVYWRNRALICAERGRAAAAEVARARGLPAQA